MKQHEKCSVLVIILYLLLGSVPGWTATKEYDLTIEKKALNFTGNSVPAMTINGGIPGPELSFTEGDLARIRVHNRMDAATSIHWHGILVPPGMDGVPLISFPPIAPGTTFTYEFPIRQNGTYWYHSHSGLQEQRGVYGPIVIHPKKSTIAADRDYVVLFSDWTNEDPHAVIRTLKRGSEWYALEKGSGQSLLGAARMGMLGDYLRRELMRMPPMDISDVAYDTFLANGKPVTQLAAKSGETIRLRIINGSATTFFFLEYSDAPLTIISADGIPVEPIEEKRLLIGVAETYDVLLPIPAQGSYELRATSHDGSGFASVWLGEGEKHHAPDVPFPNLYRNMDHMNLAHVLSATPAGVMGMDDQMVSKGMFDKPGMMMHSMEMSQKQEMKHDSTMYMPEHKEPHGGTEMSGMKQQTAHHGKQMRDMEKYMAADEEQESSEPMAMPPNEAQMTAASDTGSANHKKYGADFGWLKTDISSRENHSIDGMDEIRPFPPYAKLRSLTRTALAPDSQVREIRLTLDGDMERYTWFLNNKALSESESIRIKEGEAVRFIMINRTMMHHPMHLHGHFFRVLNGQGDYSPLKHTVDVTPMSTTVIEFDANEKGDWFFHCHLLYHMKAGMARIIHYEDFPVPDDLVPLRPGLQIDSWYSYGKADILSNMTEGLLSFSNTRNIFKANWEVGWQQVEETDWEARLTYDRYLNRFFSLTAGTDMLGEGSEEKHTRGILGFRYLLPLNIESTAWADTDSGARVILEKEFALTPRLGFIGEVEYDTHDKWEGKTWLQYTVTKEISVTAGWHSEFDWGAGLQIRF